MRLMARMLLAVVLTWAITCPVATIAHAGNERKTKPTVKLQQIMKAKQRAKVAKLKKDMPEIAAKVEKRHGKSIRKASRITGVPAKLIKAVVAVESAGRKDAVSPSGKHFGPMQVAPETAAEVGIIRVRDPNLNILAGARYLQEMMDQFPDHDSALAGYAMGPNKAKRLQRLGKLEPKEIMYVQLVNTAQEFF